MARLTEKQRNYIKAQASAPFANPTQWAKMAGYSDKSQAAKVTAFRMKHDPRIEAAALEYAGHLMHRDGPLLAVSVMMEIARNKNHPKQLAAAEAIADRIGLHRLSEHHVMVEHRDLTGTEMIARIRELAVKLGLDEAQLLGANLSRETKPEPKVIEHIPGKAERDG